MHLDISCLSTRKCTAEVVERHLNDVRVFSRIWLMWIVHYNRFRISFAVFREGIRNIFRKNQLVPVGLCLNIEKIHMCSFIRYPIGVFIRKSPRLKSTKNPIGKAGYFIDSLAWYSNGYYFLLIGKCLFHLFHSVKHSFEIKTVIF